MPASYGHAATGFLIQFRDLAMYTVPRVDVHVTAVWSTATNLESRRVGTPKADSPSGRQRKLTR